MDAYTGFAVLYDLFMDNVPYKEWASYLHEILQEYNVNDGIVLDMGCGTGNITEYLADAGYDMIGIDNSEDMLNIAIDKRDESGLDILYLLQDMREFELYGTVAAAVSICDAINYITEYDELVEVFHLVNNYLDPGGVFIFDLSTERKYLNIGDSTIAENRDEGSFIWENSYYPDERLNRYDLTVFERLPDGLYRKHEETHLLRAYTTEEIKKALSEAGLEFAAAYRAFTHDAPDAQSERIYIIAKETMKKQNG